MKWIALAFVSIFFYEVQAQKVCLLLLENSIKMKDDTLYFKFKIQNNSVDTIVFYNLNYLDNGFTIFNDPLLKTKKIIPRLLVDIFNENNQLPRAIRTRTGPKDFLEFSSIIDKYYIFKPNETREYDVALDVWPISLQKGEHKIQLRFFSNSYYDKSFRKAQKTDISLRNSVLFKGILRSNMITYTVN